MKNRLRDSGGPAPLKDLEHSSKDLRAENEEHEGQDSDEAQDEEDDHDDEYTPKQPPARNLFALVCLTFFSHKALVISGTKRNGLSH
jgi:hypothetical protein